MSTKCFRKCRLCLRLGNFGSIFEYDDSIRLSDMAMAVAQVQIVDGDGLPDRICNVCLESLSSAYLFKTQCERVYAELKKCADESDDSNDSFHSVCEELIYQEFHVHTNQITAQIENESNSIKDTNAAPNDSPYTSSDDTTDSESDINSVKCKFCQAIHESDGGVHQCTSSSAESDFGIQTASSEETLVADDYVDANIHSVNSNIHSINANIHSIDANIHSRRDPKAVSCLLCEKTYIEFNEYVDHLNKCTANVKMRFYVCPLCYDISSEKRIFLTHLKFQHFKDYTSIVAGIDTVDCPRPIIAKVQEKSQTTSYGWSLENIYTSPDELEPIYAYVNKKKPVPVNSLVIESPTKCKGSPVSEKLRSFLGKLGAEKQSTPRKLSFRKLFQDGKQKISFRRNLDSYRSKKRDLHNISLKSDELQILEENIPVVEKNHVTKISLEKKVEFHSSCGCKKIFMLSEFLDDRQKFAEMIVQLGGVVADDTKTEMLATHFVAVLPSDTCSGMMVCALATGKWLLQQNYVTDSHRGGKFLSEHIYEWAKHPKMLSLNATSLEVAKAGTFWRYQIRVNESVYPFEGTTVVLVLKKKYRQYYQMIFKYLRAKVLPYDARDLDSCSSADYCFVDMRAIHRINVTYFADKGIPVFPYQYILIYLLNRGKVPDEDQYLLQEYTPRKQSDLLNKTF